MAKIDLVEDDLSLLALIGATLEQAGHSVRRITTLGGALDWTVTAPPDLLITDVGLPDGSGLELVKRLHGRAPSVPILVLSGADTIADQQRALAVGASDFLPKPFSSVELVIRCQVLLLQPRPLSRAM